MRKNGHDRMGRQRWQCDGCRLTAGTRNNTKRRRTQLAEFLDWLLEAAPQRKRPESARNFRKCVDWCWRLAPRIEPDGVVHRVVMADGTYVNGWCLLTAVDGEDGEVLAWQWCARENTAAYKALFAQLAPPDVLVCDGMKGILKARANLAAHAGPTMSGARATRHKGRPDLQTQTAGRQGTQETR